MRDSIASILVSPEFFYRVDLLDASMGAGGAAAARSFAAKLASGASGVGTPLSAYALARPAEVIFCGPACRMMNCWNMRPAAI